jgi:hypothetical protein
MWNFFVENANGGVKVSADVTIYKVMHKIKIVILILSQAMAEIHAQERKRSGEYISAMDCGRCIILLIINFVKITRF